MLWKPTIISLRLLARLGAFVSIQEIVNKEQFNNVVLHNHIIQPRWDFYFFFCYKYILTWQWLQIFSINSSHTSDVYAVILSGSNCSACELTEDGWITRHSAELLFLILHFVSMKYRSILKWRKKKS